jgi:hypothetical protein
LGIDNRVERFEPIDRRDVRVRAAIEQILRQIVMAVADGDHQRTRLLAAADLVHVRAALDESTRGFDVPVARGEKQSSHPAHDGRGSASGGPPKPGRPLRGRIVLFAGSWGGQRISIFVDSRTLQLDDVGGDPQSAPRASSRRMTASRFSPAANIRAVWPCAPSFALMPAPWSSSAATASTLPEVAAVIRAVVPLVVTR